MNFDVFIPQMKFTHKVIHFSKGWFDDKQITL